MPLLPPMIALYSIYTVCKQCILFLVYVASTSVVITRNGTPTAGQTYSLSCSLVIMTDPATYQWFHSNETQLSDTSQLQFSPLMASHGGTYTCRASVRGVMAEDIATVIVTRKCHAVVFGHILNNLHSFLSSVPSPTTLSVTPPSMIIAGSSSSLTCTVELSTAVDIPVTVNTVWTSPAMTTVTTTSSVMESLTRYIVMANVSVATSGSYICQASIDSSSPVITESERTSNSTTVTVGEYIKTVHDLWNTFCTIIYIYIVEPDCLIIVSALDYMHDCHHFHSSLTFALRMTRANLVETSACCTTLNMKCLQRIFVVSRTNLVA